MLSRQSYNWKYFLKNFCETNYEILYIIYIVEWEVSSLKKNGRKLNVCLNLQFYSAYNLSEKMMYGSVKIGVPSFFETANEANHKVYI